MHVEGKWASLYRNFTKFNLKLYNGKSWQHNISYSNNAGPTHKWFSDSLGTNVAIVDLRNITTYMKYLKLALKLKIQIGCLLSYVTFRREDFVYLLPWNVKYARRKHFEGQMCVKHNLHICFVFFFSTWC